MEAVFKSGEVYLGLISALKQLSPCRVGHGSPASEGPSGLGKFFDLATGLGTLKAGLWKLGFPSLFHRFPSLGS